jgi:hypothetical protein
MRLFSRLGNEQKSGVILQHLFPYNPMHNEAQHFFCLGAQIFLNCNLVGVWLLVRMGS